LKQFVELLRRDALSRAERREVLKIIAKSNAGDEATRDEANRILK
jgi:hypothetical protein